MVLSPRFAATDNGTDWNDYAAQHGKPALRTLAQAELHLHDRAAAGARDRADAPAASAAQSTVAQAADQPIVTQADRDAARQRFRGGPRPMPVHAATQAAAREAARQTERPRPPRPTP